MSTWANEEFGGAKLGNTLRTERLVEIAGAVLRNPAGLVTSVFPHGKERTATYRFVENENVSSDEISASSCRASAKRAQGMPYVFVPVDQTSLSLPEYEGDAERGMGSIGSYRVGSHGLQLMNAIGVDPTGVPLGLVAQQSWAREASPAKRSGKRPLEAKETKYWMEAMRAGLSVWLAANPTTRPWFQLDRGGDFREMLAFADAFSGYWVTVRAANNRRVEGSDEKYLWETLEAAPIISTMFVDLPKAPGRQERTAQLDLRTAAVDLRVRGKTDPTGTVQLYAVLARERSTPADGSERLDWLLLTTKPVLTAADAELVVFGYTQRWRVEDFHRTLKSVCQVEKTQLRDKHHIERWLRILSAVAMRLQRLTYLARKHPGRPASEEFSPIEITALITSRGNKRGARKVGDSLKLEEAVMWIADLGGYTKYSGGPPGTIVLARGLRSLQAKAQAITEVLDYLKT